MVAVSSPSSLIPSPVAPASPLGATANNAPAADFAALLFTATPPAPPAATLPAAAPKAKAPPQPAKAASPDAAASSRDTETPAKEGNAPVVDANTTQNSETANSGDTPDQQAPDTTDDTAQQNETPAPAPQLVVAVVAAPAILDTVTISAPANTAAAAESDTSLAAALPAAPVTTPVLNTAPPQTQDNAALDALLKSAAAESDTPVDLEQLRTSLADNAPIETPRPTNDASNPAILAAAAPKASQQQQETLLPAPSAADSAATELKQQPLPPQAPTAAPVIATPTSTAATTAAVTAPLVVEAVQETVRPKNTPTLNAAKAENTAAAVEAAARAATDQDSPQPAVLSTNIAPTAANDDQATLAAPLTAAPQIAPQTAPQPTATQRSNVATATTSNTDITPATSADTLTAPIAEQKASAAPQPTDKPADKPAAPVTTTTTTDQPAPQTTPTPAPPPAPLASTASAIPPALAAHAVYGSSAGHEQIAYAMKKATDDGTQNITIRLRPHQLGLVDVQMTVSADGKIQAVLAADKPETLFWLQQDAKQLERSLQDSGLKTDSTSLSFQFRGDSGTGGYSSNQNSRNEHQNAPIEARQREVNNPSAETAEQPERSGVSTRPGALNMRV